MSAGARAGAPDTRDIQRDGRGVPGRCVGDKEAAGAAAREPGQVGADDFGAHRLRRRLPQRRVLLSETRGGGAFELIHLPTRRGQALLHGEAPVRLHEVGPGQVLKGMVSERPSLFAGRPVSSSTFDASFGGCLACRRGLSAGSWCCAIRVGAESSPEPDAWWQGPWWQLCSHRTESRPHGTRRGSRCVSSTRKRGQQCGRRNASVNSKTRQEILWRLRLLRRRRRCLLLAPPPPPLLLFSALRRAPMDKTAPVNMTRRRAGLAWVASPRRAPSGTTRRAAAPT